MKKIYIISICLLFCSLSHGQLTTLKVNGGSVVTKLSMGISVNASSSLTREWIVINDEKCPVQLKDVGINSAYVSSDYRFVPSGNIIISEPIVAYEIHHVLYDVFGGHIKSLNNLDISDMSGTIDLKKSSGAWYATENQISEYLSCVSYVAAVRTTTGVIWRFKPELIKQELSKIQIAYEEGYNPSSETKEK
jgi:hypothetical protein